MKIELAGLTWINGNLDNPYPHVTDEELEQIEELQMQQQRLGIYGILEDYQSEDRLKQWEENNYKILDLRHRGKEAYVSSPDEIQTMWKEDSNRTARNKSMFTTHLAQAPLTGSFDITEMLSIEPGKPYEWTVRK